MAVRKSGGSSRRAARIAESVILSSASASAERAVGARGSALVCQSLAGSAPGAMAGLGFRLRVGLKNVVARVFFRQAGRVVPRANWLKAGLGLGQVVRTQGPASG